MADLFGKIVALRSLKLPETATAKTCRLCASPMNEGAVKCTVCDAFDGWRRFLPASSVVLSLLVALVTVIGAVGPKFVDWLHRNSETSVFIVGGSQTELYVTAANNGNKPSAIRGFHVRFENVPLPDTDLELPDPSLAFLLPKGHRDLALRHQVIHLAGNSTPADLETSLEKGIVHLTVDVQESTDKEGSPSKRTDQVPAKQLKDWIRGCL